MPASPNTFNEGGLRRCAGMSAMTAEIFASAVAVRSSRGSSRPNKWVSSGKGNTGVIAQACCQQSLDPVGGATLQDVDIDAGVEQKLWASRRLLGHERKRLVGSAIEPFCLPRRFKSPQRPLEIKTQGRCPAGGALPARSASTRNHLPRQPSPGRTPATRYRN